MSLPRAIPRYLAGHNIRRDPLRFLTDAYAASGGIAVIAESQAVFSRYPSCAGAVTVSHPAAVREVLTTPEIYPRPRPVSERYGFPKPLVRLNAGLFSMRGEKHRAHRRLLSSILTRPQNDPYFEAVEDGWSAFRQNITDHAEVKLLGAMRRLMLHVGGRIIFGDRGLDAASLTDQYFHIRRAFTAAGGCRDAQSQQNLMAAGLRLDQDLRALVRSIRRGDERGEHVMARLSQVTNGNVMLSDTHVAAHANALWAAMSEQVAVVLTWTLLVLSQRPQLRRALRAEVSALLKTKSFTEMAQRPPPVLSGVIRETLRLFPPNSIMVRLTAKPATLCGHRLPKGCEVVISPFVMHRDPRHFADPDHFDANRWRSLRPSPSCYLPFGLGEKYCLGRDLANHILAYAIGRLTVDFEVVLRKDQRLDWKVDVTLMPSSDPIVQLRPWSAGVAVRYGRLRGPAASLGLTV